MITLKHRILFLIVLFFSLTFYSFSPPPSRSNGSGLRFYVGPNLSFYKLHTKHAVGVSPRMSGIAGFKKEIRCDKVHKTFFLFGADYFFHGLNFKSYYFDQDTLQLYDKSFAYDYNLFMHEVNVPLQVKFSFTRENNSLYSPYIIAGYHFRYLMPGRVMVSQDGNLISNNWEEFNFKIPFIGSKTNSFVSVGFGWQKNTINNSKTGFFVEVNFRYGFSQYSFKGDYSASSLYMNGTHTGLLLGIKF